MSDLAHGSHSRIIQSVVASPGDKRYEAGRQTFNLAADQHPRLVALPRNALDVIDAINLAADLGLRVAPQLTGHGALALPGLADTLLLRTDLMRELEIDFAARRARAGAGMRWGAVIDAADRSCGLVALHAPSRDVGVVGYTLGGGASWYLRRHGLAADHITAVELVGADGQYRRVDRYHDAELFWGLHGSDGNLGVVTALEFELLPIPEIYGGSLFFPWERSAEVLLAWRDWLREAPDELTSNWRLVTFPQRADIPPSLCGRTLALVDAVYAGPVHEGRRITGRMRQLGPLLDTMAALPSDAVSTLSMYPREPLAYGGDHQLLRELPDSAVEAILELLGPERGSPLPMFELRRLGGALARRAPDAGPLRIEEPYATFAVSRGPGSDDEETLERLREALTPHASDRVLPSVAMRPVAPERMFDELALGRLRRLRDRMDPTGMFVVKHPL